MIALSCDYTEYSTVYWVQYSVLSTVQCTEYSTVYWVQCSVLTSPPADDIVQQTTLAHAADQEEYGQTQGGNLDNS